jgi:hypothetical protein
MRCGTDRDDVDNDHSLDQLIAQATNFSGKRNKPFGAMVFYASDSRRPLTARVCPAWLRG